MSKKKRIKKALKIIYKWGSTDGEHHKQWVLDKVVQALSKDYEQWCIHRQYPEGTDGEDCGEWDKGIAP